MPEIICSVCLYVRPRPGLSEDDLADTTLLTVINGQMVCVRHAGCASETHHSTLMSGVHLESQGEFTSLSAYQDWHYKQRREQESEGTARD